jgi:hypothetical protein
MDFANGRGFIFNNKLDQLKSAGSVESVFQIGELENTYCEGGKLKVHF